MAIDRLKFHLDDADSEEQAAAHMALFMEWAANKDFLSDKHDRDQLLDNPVRYVIDEVPDIADSDFTDEALEFVRAHYSEYLDYLAEHAEEAGMSSYQYAASPEGREDLLECLDEALEEFED
jgi:hypothetical protein